jgi:hypothetical protein
MFDLSCVASSEPSTTTTHHHKPASTKQQKEENSYIEKFFDRHDHPDKKQTKSKDDKKAKDKAPSITSISSLMKKPGKYVDKTYLLKFVKLTRF